MKTIEKECLNCQIVFDASLKEHKRGNAKFCCHPCASEFRWGKILVHHNSNVVCAFCDSPFYKRPVHQKSSKSGLFFCTRKCKDAAQRIGGISEIMPHHYGTGNGRHDYRNRALNEYGHICKECGYKEHPEILTVHHIDKDRNNNKLENLVVLCPNCHFYLHWTKNNLSCLA